MGSVIVWLVFTLCSPHGCETQRLEWLGTKEQCEMFGQLEIIPRKRADQYVSGYTCTTDEPV